MCLFQAEIRLLWKMRPLEKPACQAALGVAYRIFKDRDPGPGYLAAAYYRKTGDYA